MNTATIIKLGVSAVLFVAGLVGWLAVKKDSGVPEDAKKKKKKSRLFFVLMIISAWFFIGVIITAVSKIQSNFAVEFNMFSDRRAIFGENFRLFGKTFTVSETSILMWKITAVITILAVLFRVFAIPRFKDSPKGLQNLMELAVEAMDKFTKGAVCDFSNQLSPYMFALAFFMVGCAASELIGCRPPTSDITVTLAMGLITFVLINYYGIRKKGIGGRLGSLTKPTPVILPMKILSDISLPISLACRLFGNMIGGMIVMDLLKGALGGYAIGLPAVAGLYFNLFHPLIQVYIFIILSLTFINEAIE